MNPTDAGTGFKILGVDDVVYGPVELPVLISWVQEDRVTADTWVYSEAGDWWRKAPQVPELQIIFRKKAGPAHAAAAGATPTSGAVPGGATLQPGSLRRVKIFADLSDAQLQALMDFIQITPVRQWTEIVKQGEPGDAMYLIMDGEVRVRLMIGKKETTLATLGPGEFFGEISLFDDGPRSADIVANKDSQLLKINIDDFRRLTTAHPDVAAPLLMAVGRTLTARIRADNKRYRDSISFARAAGP